MATPLNYPPAAQLRVLADRIAAKVVPRRHLPGKPQARTDDQHIFAQRLIETVLQVRKLDPRPYVGAKPGPALREAAVAARRLQDAYSRMSKRSRDWVAHIKGTRMLFLAGGTDLEAAISNVATVLHTALGKTTPILKPPRGSKRCALYKQVGMLEPRVKDQTLRELVFGLLYAARETGGEFDFNKNSASGTLAETLRLLRDGQYLPPDLVPDPLPAFTIQRLKTEFSRLTR